MKWRNKRLGSGLGGLSLILSILTPVAVFHPDAISKAGRAGEIEFGVCVGGSVVAALAAGIIASRWWFLAFLGTIAALLTLFLFSP